MINPLRFHPILPLPRLPEEDKKTTASNSTASSTAIFPPYHPPFAEEEKAAETIGKGPNKRPITTVFEESAPPYPQEACITPPHSPRIPPVSFISPDRLEHLKRPLPDTPSRIPYADQPWYLPVRAQLMNLQRIAAERGLFDDAIEEFTKEPASLGLDNPKDILVLLKLLSGHIFSGVEPGFYHLLRELRTQLPDLEDYMEEVLSLEGQGPVLKPQGIQKIIEFFESEYGYPPGLLSCHPVSELPDLVEEMTTNYQKGEGWAVYHDLFEDDRRIVLVFAISHEGKVHIFIFDSLGHDVHQNPE